MLNLCLIAFFFSLLNTLLTVIFRNILWATDDAMVGWHHWLNGHECEQTLGDSEGQGSLVCCSPWGSQRVRHHLGTEQQHSCGIKQWVSRIHISSGYLEKPLAPGMRCWQWLLFFFFFLILHFPLPHASSGSKTECFWIFPVHLDWVWSQFGRGCAGPPWDGHTGWEERNPYHLRRPMGHNTFYTKRPIAFFSEKQMILYLLSSGLADNNIFSFWKIFIQRSYHFYLSSFLPAGILEHMLSSFSVKFLLQCPFFCPSFIYYLICMSVEGLCAKGESSLPVTQVNEWF